MSDSLLKFSVSTFTLTPMNVKHSSILGWEQREGVGTRNIWVIGRATENPSALIHNVAKLKKKQPPMHTSQPRATPLSRIYHHFDHGCKASATERAGWCPLSVKRGHRRPKPREGDLKRHTRQSRLWLCRRPPSHHQSKFSPAPRWSTAGSLHMAGLDG